MISYIFALCDWFEFILLKFRGLRLERNVCGPDTSSIDFVNTRKSFIFIILQFNTDKTGIILKKLFEFITKKLIRNFKKHSLNSEIRFLAFDRRAKQHLEAKRSFYSSKMPLHNRKVLVKFDKIHGK